jgi:hypothetical protein
VPTANDSSGCARRIPSAQLATPLRPARQVAKASSERVTAAPAAGKQPKLRPGELDGLVLKFMKDNANSGPHSPTSVDKARSSTVSPLVLDQPRRYDHVDGCGSRRSTSSVSGLERGRA